MKRPFAIVGIPVFLVLSVLYKASGTAVSVTALVAAVLLGVSLLVKSLRQGKAVPAVLAGVTAACLVLIIHNELFYFPSLSISGQTGSAVLTLTSEPEYKNGNFYYKAKLREFSGGRAGMNVRLVFSSPPDASPYDSVEGEFSFYALGADSHEAAEYDKAENLYIGARPLRADYQIIKNESKLKRPGYYAILFRQGVKRAVMRMLPNDYGALCLALITGDRTEMSRTAYLSLKSAGITHLICVSGLHVSIWSSAILFILRRLRIGEKAAALLAMPFTALVVFAAGMTWSAVRAGIMMLLFLLSIVISRRRDPLNSLGAALAVIAAVNPFAMGSVSLRLSALATLGIILCSQYAVPFMREYFEKRNVPGFARRVFYALAVTAFAVGFCLPVTIGVYGCVNLCVFPSNLLTVWAAEACMAASALGAALSAVLGSVFNPPALAAGLLAKYILRVSSLFNGVSFLNVRIPEKNGYIMLCALFVFCALAVLAAYSGGKVLPAAPVITAALVAFSLVLYSFGAANVTRIRVLDTGNGTAVLVSHAGKNVLVGCGGDSYSGYYEAQYAVEDFGGRLDLIAVPAAGSEYDSFLYKIAEEYPPEALSLPEEISPIGLAEEGAEILPAGSEIITGDIKLTPVDRGGAKACLLETPDVSALIVTGPTAALPEKEFKNVNVLITRMDFPEMMSFDNLSYAVVEADNLRGCAVQDSLISQGVNAAATAGCGSIELTAKNGRVTASRIS